MIKTRAILEYEGHTKIARIRERLDQIRQYKRVIAEEGLEPDAADKQLESELIIRLLRLEKDLGLRPSKTQPGRRPAGDAPAKGAGQSGQKGKRGAKPKSGGKARPGANAKAAGAPRPAAGDRPSASSRPRTDARPSASSRPRTDARPSSGGQRPAAPSRRSRDRH